ncbi:MAG: hypothetical protein ACO1RX_11100 [Candidatus Sericytochromatia bacterium]
MPNLTPGGTPPLLPPQQLWGAKPAPARPAQAPPPVVTPPAALPATLPPLSRLPAAGSSAPVYSFADTQNSLGAQATRLQSQLKNAEQDVLGRYQVQLVKNEQGQISGYLVQGKPARAEDVQRYLLPIAGELHGALEGLKRDIQQTYTGFVQQLDQQLPALAPSEQTAVRIQRQAVDVVYASLLQRIGQVDQLIK